MGTSPVKDPWLSGMFAAKHYPEYISHQELDEYLARGWYRMGQTIFTTQFLCFEEAFYSAIWIRQDLEGYQFRKSLRKIIRRNSDRYRSVFRPFQLNREAEMLYQRYKRQFDGVLAPTLRDSLLDGDTYNIFDTYEFAVYDKDRLIAISYFDLGEQSIASIMGIYDPLYQKDSLGIYTMLMEVAFGIQNNYRYYYPGYVVPGYARFDYKLRVGNANYFDIRSGQWLPFTSSCSETAPISVMEKRLSALYTQMAIAGIPANLQYYPLFEANLFGFWRIPFFDYPVLLHCGKIIGSGAYYIVVYDPRTDRYQLFFCTNFDDIQFYFNEAYTNAFDSQLYFMDLIMIDHVIETSSQPEIIISAIQREMKKSS